MARHILLIGMMGSGKSTVGRSAARKLGRRYLDTDSLIERQTGRRISEIFAEQGEEAFRKLETETLLRLQRELNRPTVIACGGGMVLSAENRELIKGLGNVFWLRLSLEHLTQRLKFSRRRDRPLLDRDDWQEALAALVNEREPFYREAATVTITGDSLSPEQVAEQIVRTVRMLERRR